MYVIICFAFAKITWSGNQKYGEGHAGGFLLAVHRFFRWLAVFAKLLHQNHLNHDYIISLSLSSL